MPSCFFVGRENLLFVSSSARVLTPRGRVLCGQGPCHAPVVEAGAAEMLRGEAGRHLQGRFRFRRAIKDDDLEQIVGTTSAAQSIENALGIHAVRADNHYNRNGGASSFRHVAQARGKSPRNQRRRSALTRTVQKDLTTDITDRTDKDLLYVVGTLGVDLPALEIFAVEQVQGGVIARSMRRGRAGRA